MYLFERHRNTHLGRERENEHLLVQVHTLNAYLIQGWARLKLEVDNSILASKN